MPDIPSHVLEQVVGHEHHRHISRHSRHLPLAADTLLLLSNVPGLLRAFPDESTLIARIERGAVEEYLPVAQGRMKKKVLGAAEALAGGVGRVILGDARVAQPVSRALAGAGTAIE